MQSEPWQGWSAKLPPDVCAPSWLFPEALYHEKFGYTLSRTIFDELQRVGRFQWLIWCGFVALFLAYLQLNQLGAIWQQKRLSLFLSLWAFLLLLFWLMVRCFRWFLHRKFHVAFRRGRPFWLRVESALERRSHDRAYSPQVRRGKYTQFFSASGVVYSAAPRSARGSTQARLGSLQCTIALRKSDLSALRPGCHLACILVEDEQHYMVRAFALIDVEGKAHQIAFVDEMTRKMGERFFD